LQGYLAFIFLDIAIVYMSNPNTREFLTLLKAINAIKDIALAMLILPSSLLVKGKFDNDIKNKVLLKKNLETTSGYFNN
jgi:hypothetical protein